MKNAKKCIPYTDKFPDPSHHPLAIAIFAVLYFAVFIVSLAGNAGVIYATVRYRSLQTVQNIFIVNLAVSGVILCFLSIPTPVTNIAKQWFFGDYLCRVVGGIQAIGLFIGTFSLAAIALDRYFRLVVAPGNPLRRKSAIRVTIGMWLFSMVAALPYVYYMKLISYPRLRVCGIFCTERWPNESSKRIYTIFVLIIQFVIPFLIMAFCYRSVFAFLRRRAKTRLTQIAQQANMLYVMAATAAGDSQQHKDQLTHLIEQKKRVVAQKRRVTVILVSMVLIFGITALPHNIVSTLLEFRGQNILVLDDTDFTYLVTLITHLLSMLSCVVNPMLYAFLNPEFRELILSSLSGFRWAHQFSRTWQPTQTTVL